MNFFNDLLNIGKTKKELIKKELEKKELEKKINSIVLKELVNNNFKEVTNKNIPYICIDTTNMELNLVDLVEKYRNVLSEIDNIRKEEKANFSKLKDNLKKKEQNNNEKDNK